VPLKALAFVAALAGGDYLLWNDSLSGNHEVLALISGFALAPLLIVLTWLVLSCLARMLLSRPQWLLGSRGSSHPGAPATGAAGAPGAASARGASRSATMTGRWDPEQTAAEDQPSPGSSPGKLAA
jgi:hypothetical protein